MARRKTMNTSSTSTTTTTNNNNNNSSNRNCWQSKRERDRRQARYEIRERIISGKQKHQQLQQHPKNNTNIQQQRHDDDYDYDDHYKYLQEEEEEICTTKNPINSSSQFSVIVKQLLLSIMKGDRSKFSITLIHQNYEILSSRIPIEFLFTSEKNDDDDDNDDDNNDDNGKNKNNNNNNNINININININNNDKTNSTILEHALQLCHAWFGQEYENKLKLYITECLQSFTIIEFAIWMGKYSILGSLLVGGINPCIHGNCCKTKMDDDNNKNNNKSNNDSPSSWEHVMGSKVLQRFFDCFPLPLSTYIVKRIVELRIDSAALKARLTATATGTSSHSCMICKSEKQQQQRRLLLLNVSPNKCQHTICEICLWTDIISNIDNRGNLDDVVICPICPLQTISSSPNLTAKLNSDDRDYSNDEVCSSSTTIQNQRAAESLSKLLMLPSNRKELKSSGRKRLKPKELDLISSNWFNAVKSSLGLTQDVRKDKLFNFVTNPKSIQYVKGCLLDGVDINNWINEYGQTPLYIAVWKSNIPIAKLLLEYGANPFIAANGGSTVLDICQNRNYHDLIDIIITRQNSNHINNSIMGLPSIEYPRHRHHHMRDILMRADATTTKSDNDNAADDIIITSHPSLQVIIPKSSNDNDHHHPGAGAYIIDNAISSSQIQILLDLHDNLPIDLTQKKKSNNPLCSERSYYCDYDFTISKILEQVICQVGLATTSASAATAPSFSISSSTTCKKTSTVNGNATIQLEASSNSPSHGNSTTTTTATAKSSCCKVLPHMRFLNYSNPGGVLAPHVDLCRVDPFDDDQHRRSTHTLILYLTTCKVGGETCLLRELKKSRSSSSDVLASVSVIRGRMLLFPHLCPHMGNKCLDVPKILLRGEVILD